MSCSSSTPAACSPPVARADTLFRHSVAHAEASSNVATCDAQIYRETHQLRPSLPADPLFHHPCRIIGAPLGLTITNPKQFARIIEIELEVACSDTCLMPVATPFNITGLAASETGGCMLTSTEPRDMGSKQVQAIPPRHGVCTSGTASRKRAVQRLQQHPLQPDSRQPHRSDGPPLLQHPQPPQPPRCSDGPPLLVATKRLVRRFGVTFSETQKSN